MAKILVTIDTESKELIVDVNGKMIDNVCEVRCMYNPENEYSKEMLYVDIHSMVKDESGVMTRTHVMASEKKTLNDFVSQLVKRR